MCPPVRGPHRILPKNIGIPGRERPPDCSLQYHADPIAERATGALHKPAQRNAQQFGARTHLPPDWLPKLRSIFSHRRRVSVKFVIDTRSKDAGPKVDTFRKHESATKVIIKYTAPT